MGSAAIQPEHFDPAIVAWITGRSTRSACFSSLITSVVRSFVEQGAIMLISFILPEKWIDEPLAPCEVRIMLEAPQSQIFDQGASGKETIKPRG